MEKLSFYIMQIQYSRTSGTVFLFDFCTLFQLFKLKKKRHGDIRMHENISLRSEANLRRKDEVF